MRFTLFFFLLSVQFVTQSQTALLKNFERIEVRLDTAVFSWKNNIISIKGEKKLAFEYMSNTSNLEVRLYPNKTSGLSEIISLEPSLDFEVIDSIQFIDGAYYRLKIRLLDIANSDFISLLFKLRENEEESIMTALPLFPYTTTSAMINIDDNELFIGEEKTFEILTNRPQNILINPQWFSTKSYDYRVYRSEDKIMLSVLPSVTGEIELSLSLALKQPIIQNNELTYSTELKPINFLVKGSRLSFLKFDVRDITWERSNSQGYEVQIDYNRSLQLNKTYRFEASDEPGGALIAELYTVRRMSNNKVLCILRPYNYHKAQDGYLFIKDGDQAQFITNITIYPESKINRVSMLRKGGSWVNSNQIYPGETVELRLEGESLSRGDFYFEGLEDVSSDSILRNGSVVHYMIRVPSDIRKKAVSIYNRDKKTGVSLDIIEHQRPRELDFVVVEYGGAPRVVNRITQPILHSGTIGDVSIQFDSRYIDEPDYLYGKQYMEVEVLLKNSANILIERYTIDDIEVCPGEDSPRSFSYAANTDCINPLVSINDYLSYKTHSLEHWAKIELIIRHRKGFYSSRGFSQRIEIIKEKLVTFDVDLTIPAGLLIKKVGEEGFPGLSGVSLSMLAQFSFYRKGEIQKLRPYKVGAGFLAQNAFNFNPDADRDLGLVVLGSVYPTRKNRKFSFPLYAGFGYFLNESKFFYLIGPGVQINL